MGVIICLKMTHPPGKGIPPSFLVRLTEIAQGAGLSFVRCFGSATRDWPQARDLDLLVDLKPDATFEIRIRLQQDLEQAAQKPIDLLSITDPLPGTLVQEIAAHSIPLWEAPRLGRSRYTDWMSPAWAIAEDERLAYPPEQRLRDLRARQALLKKRAKLQGEPET